MTPRDYPGNLEKTRIIKTLEELGRDGNRTAQDLAAAIKHVDNNYTDSNTRSKFFYLTRFRFLGHMEIVCFDCNSKIHWRHPFMTPKLAWWLLDRKCDRNEKKQWKQTLKAKK